MTSKTTGSPHQFNITDEEAVTLRRVAFGQSDIRTLRRADLEQLLHLRLIEKVQGGLRLTTAGKEHFDSLPRGVFADAPRQRNGLPPSAANPVPSRRERANRQWQLVSGPRGKDPDRG
jgi:hypothetical protein